MVSWIQACASPSQITFTKPTSRSASRATTQPRLCLAVSSTQFHSALLYTRVVNAAACSSLISSLAKAPRHWKRTLMPQP